MSFQYIKNQNTDKMNFVDQDKYRWISLNTLVVFTGKKIALNKRNFKLIYTK